MPFVISDGNPYRQMIKSMPKTRALGLFLACFFATSLYGQAPQPATGLPPVGQDSAVPSPIPGAVPTAHPSNTDTGTKKPRGQFPSDAATQPAKVRVDGGRISVEANNSDLAEILHQVSNLSGIAIQGLNGGPRVFGVYGPGDAREVLTALLSGSGYNFVMVGGAGGGPPREVLLTPRVAQSAAPPKVDPGNDPDAEVDEPDQSDNTPPPPPPPTPTLAPEKSGPPQTKDQEDEEVQKTLERLKVIHDHQQDAPPQD